MYLPQFPVGTAQAWRMGKAQKIWAQEREERRQSISMNQRCSLAEPRQAPSLFTAADRRPPDGARSCLMEALGILYPRV